MKLEYKDRSALNSRFVIIDASREDPFYISSYDRFKVVYGMRNEVQKAIKFNSVEDAKEVIEYMDGFNGIEPQILRVETTLNYSLYEI